MTQAFQELGWTFIGNQMFDAEGNVVEPDSGERGSDYVSTPMSPETMTQEQALNASLGCTSWLLYGYSDYYTRTYIWFAITDWKEITGTRYATPEGVNCGTPFYAQEIYLKVKPYPVRHFSSWEQTRYNHIERGRDGDHPTHHPTSDEKPAKGVRMHLGDGITGMIRYGRRHRLTRDQRDDKEETNISG